MSRKKIYGIWKAMVRRCTKPADPNYMRYGGRGISVAESWLSFENFYADMGERPAGKSLDRIDNNKGYSKENCRWVDHGTQMQNSRATHKHLYRGEMLTLREIAEKYGLNLKLLNHRVRYYKYSLDDIIAGNLDRKVKSLYE